MAQPEEMYQCQTTNCGYIYNPDKGDRKGKIPAGTKFEDLPDEWRCPVCGGASLAALGSKLWKLLPSEYLSSLAEIQGAAGEAVLKHREPAATQ